MTKVRRKRSRARRSRRAEVAAAAATLALVAGLLVLGTTAQRGLPARDYYELDAVFRDAANLNQYAEVRIAGRRVGQVLAVEPADGKARVRLQLDPDSAPLREGTRARIRLKGLLGAKFVELYPAPEGEPLASGGVLTTADTSATVELADVFETLDERRRAHLRATIQGLGTGFLGRGEDLNRALGDFPGALADLDSVVTEVNERPGAAARLVPALEDAAAAFDPVRSELALGFDPQARALAPFSDRAESLRSALELAPGSLASLEEGLGEADPLLVQAERLAVATSQLTGPAPESLQATAALLRDGQEPLRRASGLLRLTGEAVPPTLRLLDSAAPLVEPTSRALRTSEPLLAEAERRRCDLLGFGRNWRSLLSWGLESEHEIGPVTGVRTAFHTASAWREQAPGELPEAPTGRAVGVIPEPCELGPVEPVGGTGG